MKRPFCNAFTGCGRKRSGKQHQRQSNEKTPVLEQMEQMEQQRQQQNQNQQQEQQTSQQVQDDLELDDSIGSLLDLNSEPAVEDLMRQIMSEAKLWEAIQEANREINIQKFGKKLKTGRLNIAFSAQ